jgi:hypothetical protein
MGISQAGRARALLSSVKTLREKWAQKLSYAGKTKRDDALHFHTHIQLLPINRLIVFRESLKAVLAHDQCGFFN